MKPWQPAFHALSRNGKPIFFKTPARTDYLAFLEVWENNGYVRPRLGFEILDGEKWLDLGGNVGAFSTFAAERGASVLCYEPSPRNCAILRDNTERYGFRVEIVQEAVSDKDGVVPFFEDLEQPWRCSLVNPRVNRILSVKCVSLSEVLARYSPVGIKMDIEGSEMGILDNTVWPDCVKKIALEYHFDIDASIARAKARKDRLSSQFTNIRFNKQIESGVGQWKHFPMADVWFAWR